MFGSVGVILAEVVLAVGAVFVGIWAMGKWLDRQAEQELDEIRHADDNDDDDRLISR